MTSSEFEEFHVDWERQRDALSALLDGELEPERRQQLERHLATCEQCRAEHASLGLTRALVRALPQPALPRSFALPVETTPTVRSIVDARARRAHSGAFSRLSQRVGSLVAAAGLILLIGSWLTSVSSPMRSSSGAAKFAPQGAGAQNTHITTTAAPAHTAPPYTGATRGPEAGTSATSAPTPASASATATATLSRVATHPNNDSASSVPILPLTGAGLTVGGVLLVVAGKATKGRQSRGG